MKHARDNVLRSVRPWLLLLALGAGCGGTTQPANNPDDNPPLDDPGKGGSGPVATASSEKVKSGIDAIQAGDFARAKSVLSEAHAADPKDPQAAFYLGVAVEQLGDPKGAVELYQQALALDPKLTEASQNLSAILLDTGDAKRALEVVDAALAHAPKHPALLMNRALAREAAGDEAGALEAYGAASAAAPDNLELAFAHGELAAKAGKKDVALAALRKVAAGADPKLLLAGANLLAKLGAFADCVAALDKAIGKKPGADLHTRRGVCRHELKDEPGARGDYEAALKLDPKYAPAHYYLGMHFKTAGKAKEAQAALEKAVELAGGQGVGEAAKKALEELKGAPKK